MLSIYAAVELSSAEAVKEALVSGADVNCTVSKARKVFSHRTMVENDTPLHLAIERRQAGIARLLMSAGANPNAKRLDCPLKSIRDTGGEQALKKKITPLQLAVVQGGEMGEELVKLLVTNGADIRPLLAKGKSYKSKYLAMDFFIPQAVNLVMTQHLSVLDLSHCQLEVLPASIVTRNGRVNEQLLHLKELNLSHNKLSVLPPEIAHLSNLQVLRVNGNLIEKLPTSLVRLKGVLTRLKAHDNPMRVPPMYVIHKGTRATLDFLNDVLEGTVEPQLTLKLLLVGQENVGKTSLRHAIEEMFKRSFGGTLSRQEAKDTSHDSAPLSLQLLMECTEGGVERTSSPGEKTRSMSGGGSWRRSLANLNSWAKPSRKNVRAPSAEAVKEKDGLSTDGIDISTVTIPVKLKSSKARPATKMKVRPRSVSTKEVTTPVAEGRKKSRLSRVQEEDLDFPNNRVRAGSDPESPKRRSESMDAVVPVPRKLSPRGLVRYSTALESGEHRKRSSLVLSDSNDNTGRPKSVGEGESSPGSIKRAMSQGTGAKRLSKSGNALSPPPRRSASTRGGDTMASFTPEMELHSSSSVQELTKRVKRSATISGLPSEPEQEEQSYVAPSRREMLTKLFTLDLDALYSKMTHSRTGIGLRSYKHKFKKLKDCCSGELLVGWLVMHCDVASSRYEAEVVGELLLRKGYIRSALKSQQFMDSPQHFYYLTGLDLLDAAITFNVYDFGGQEVYYPTHQFFLTQNSLYVVVFDMTKPIHYSRVSYWLEAIYARASSDANIIIVGTHADCKLHHGKSAIEILNMVESEFYHRYRSIKGVIAVSSSNGQGIEDLCELLRSTALQYVESAPLVPVKVRYIERALEAEAEKNSLLPILSWDEVRKVGELYQISSRKQLRSVVQHLHDVGKVLLHHGTKRNIQQDLVCSDVEEEHLMAKLDGSYIILKPQWMARCMSSIVTTKLNFISNGILYSDSLDLIWHHTSEFPKHLHPFLLTLLQNFEIIYPLADHCISALTGAQDSKANELGKYAAPTPSGKAYLVPCLLSEQSQLPDIWLQPAPADSFNRVFQFKFIPHGLFPRLIVQLLRKADDILHTWKYGIVLIIGNSYLACMQDLRGKRIIVEARSMFAGATASEDDGSCSEPEWAQQGLAAVRAVDAVCSFWFCVHVTKFIACNHCLDEQRRGLLDMSKPLTSVHLFSQSQLEVSILNGKETLVCPNGKVRMPINQIAPSMAISARDTNPNQIELTGRQLGKGAFGSVEEADVEGYGRCAVKQFLAVNFEEYASSIRRELALMSQISHPNIVNMLGYSVQPLQLVMELVPLGDLHTFLHSREEVGWGLRTRIALDVCLGMAHLHASEPPIVHRDLKTPNILIVDRSDVAPITAKVADFGLSWDLHSGTMREVAGARDVHTPYWLAPEIIREEEYTGKADVYAFGIVLWELLTRNNPFEEYKKKFTWQVEKLIIQGKRPTIPPTYRKLSKPEDIKLRKHKKQSKEKQARRTSVEVLTKLHMEKIAKASPKPVRRSSQPKCPPNRPCEPVPALLLPAKADVGTSKDGDSSGTDKESARGQSTGCDSTGRDSTGRDSTEPPSTPSYTALESAVSCDSSTMPLSDATPPSQQALDESAVASKPKREPSSSRDGGCAGSPCGPERKALGRKDSLGWLAARKASFGDADCSSGRPPVPAIPIDAAVSEVAPDDAPPSMTVVERMVAKDYISLMQSCWDDDPSVRPSFSVLQKKFQAMCEVLTEHDH